MCIRDSQHAARNQAPQTRSAKGGPAQVATDCLAADQTARSQPQRMIGRSRRARGSTGLAGNLRATEL
eukprot:8144988-Alexandrium_andersonii.AAC.1